MKKETIQVNMNFEVIQAQLKRFTQSALSEIQLTGFFFGIKTVQSLNSDHKKLKCFQLSIFHLTFIYFSITDT